MEIKMKRGRPPLPEDEKKSKSVRIRLTTSELDNVVNEAVANGVTVSDYIREKINDGANEGS